jgi:hypothetical protein
VIGGPLLGGFLADNVGLRAVFLLRHPAGGQFSGHPVSDQRGCDLLSANLNA